MRQHFLSDLLMGVRGKVTLGIPPFPNKTVGTPGSSGLKPLDGFAVPRRNLPVPPASLEDMVGHVCDRTFKKSKLFFTVSAAIVSLIVSTSTYAALYQQAEGSDPTFLQGQWQPGLFPTLIVNSEDGIQNIYNYQTSLSSGTAAIEFLEGASLDITLSSGDGFSVTGDASLNITGAGALYITDPGTDDIYSNHAGFYVVGSSNKRPLVNIGGNNSGNVDIVFEARRGIAIGGGATFKYECSGGTIYVGGGQTGAGLGPFDWEKPGLLTGIIARAESTGNPNLIDITAENLYIYSGGASQNRNNTEMISTTSVGNATSPSYNENVTIKMNVANIYLWVGDGEDSVITGNYSGHGIYSQSGKSFESRIELTGNNFEFLSLAEGWFGIYMLDYGGSKNSIYLNFTDSVSIHTNSSYSVAGIRYANLNMNDTTLDIHAGNQDGDVLSIINDDGVVLDNAGERFNISGKEIRISSQNSYAVWTTYYAAESGVTNITSPGGSIIIQSLGSPEDGFAVVTAGNAKWSGSNGLTNISGAQTISIFSKDGGAVITQGTGTTVVEGSKVESTVEISSTNGYAVGTYGNSTLEISGNQVSIISSGEGSAKKSFAIETTESSTSTISGDTVTIAAPCNFTAGTSDNSDLSVSGNNVFITSINGDAVVTSENSDVDILGNREVAIASTNGYAVDTSGTSTVEILGETASISIGSTTNNAVYTSLGSSANIKGNSVTVRSDNAGTIITESSSDTTVTGAQVNITSGTDYAIETNTSATTSVIGDTVLITNGNIEEVTIETVPNTIPYVIGTMDQGSTANINYDSSTEVSVGQTTLIAGRVLSYNSGATNIGMNSASSVFVGSTDDGTYFQDEKEGKHAFGNLMDGTTQGSNSNTAGTISIYGGNGSTWIVKPNPVSIFDQINGLMNQWSNLSKYQSDGFSLVDLTTTEAAQDLNIGTLTGNSASFRLRTYIDEQRITGGSGDETQTRDHVNLLYGNGQHFIVLSQGSTGIGVPYPEQFDYLVWSREPNTLYILNPKTGETEGTPGDDNLSFKLGVINEGNVDELPYVEAISKIDMGIYNYFLTTRDRAHDGIDMEGIEFFLSRGEGRGPDGGPDYSPSTDLDRTLAGFGGVYAIWWAELSDLRKRLGEVRYGAQDGAWAKVLAQKDDIVGVGSGRFTQKLYAVNLGIDHIAVQSEDRMWLLGGNFKYANANQRIKHSRYGKGDIHNWGMNLYATYANQYGCYSDLVFTYDHYKRKVNSRMLDNTPVGAKWNNYGLGISLEIGKMFSSTQNDEGWGPWYNHWWIEPQAQLAYYWVHGTGFTLSNGLQAKQGNTDFLTGRLGVVIGKKFNYGKDRAVVDKRYSQFYIKGGIKHEFLGNQRLTLNDTANEVTFKGTLRGTRVYYGGGFDWNFTDQLRLYAQIERENGGKYKKDYEVSVGLRWQF